MAIKLKSSSGTVSIAGAGIPGKTPQKGVDYWTEEDKAEIVDEVQNAMQEKLAAKANKGELVGVDIKTVTDSGIYSIGSDCTGLPEDLPAYYCGATLIVDNIPTDTEYTSANQYLIVNDYVDENGDYTYKSRIYACMLYGGSYDLPWQLVCDGAWGDELAGKADTSYVDEALKLKADLAWIKSLLPQSTASGTSITLTDHLEGMEVINYSIYGNSTQDGEPTPETPIEIQSVGDLVTDEEDENYGKYDVPVTVNDETYHIYINEPLRKVGDCADYIDFENQQIVRNVQRIVPTISDGIALYSYNDTNGIAFRNVLKEGGTRIIGLCTHSNKVYNTGSAGAIWCGANGNTTIYWIGVLDLLGLTTVDEFKEWMATQICRFEVICKRITPVYEPITIPPLTVVESDTVTVSSDTGTQPGNMEVTYYQDNSKRIAALEAAITALGGV